MLNFKVNALKFLSMIVKLNFYSDEYLELPINYTYLVQSAIYRKFDSNISKFLHDEGFTMGKKKFKLFTFSRIISRFSILDDLIVFRNPISIYFASIFDNFVISLLENLIKTGYMNLNEKKLHFKGYEVVKPNFQKKTYKTLSPITVYRTFRKKTIFYGPKDKDFKELIFENLKKKFLIVYSKDYEGKFDFKFKSFKKEVVKYKNGIIIGYSGKLSIDADESLMKILLHCGIGSKNSLGFGMVL